MQIVYMENDDGRSALRFLLPAVIDAPDEVYLLHSTGR